jgi:protoporphyrinogen oxidase
MKDSGKSAIIIGAGPAGLTAGLEFLRRSGIKPILLEASHEIGGISRTIRYKGNRMDIGGHRFFSKSDRVMNWWMDLMPTAAEDAAPERMATETIHYRGTSRELPLRSVSSGSSEYGSAVAVAELPETETASDTTAQDEDLVMLVRPRKSRIYYLRKFFDYPIKLTRATLQNLGLLRVFKVGVSYAVSRVHQIRPERNLEDFLINRFGRELYLTFFKSYTEKVWGTPCHEISAEWGAQRIKGLSLMAALKHFLRTSLAPKRKQDAPEVAQKDVDTSLIERFLYPKLGPGQLWEHVAGLIQDGVQAGPVKRRGEIHMGMRVNRIVCDGDRIDAVEAVDEAGRSRVFRGDYFLSTMPVRELIDALDAPVPQHIREISNGLQYRDFITVGLLVDRLKIKEPDGSLLKDTWIYIQEPDVLLGRLQIFNNWSPSLVSDPDKVWIGLEYFCYETDDLWKMSDDAMMRFAIEEVVKIGILDSGAVFDGHVVRVPKTYPAYFGTYNRFPELRGFTDSFTNLFLIGRNGMHKYNNQDHSMLTAMTVVDGLVDSGHVDRELLWGINTEQDYHEAKK